MTYFEQKPKGRLSAYIDKFWYCQSENLTNKTLTIPLLHHELVFNFSDYHYISQNTGSGYILKNPRSWLSGIQTKPNLSESTGKHEMIGVLFKPVGLKAFTKYHSNEFENSFIDPTLIFGRSFETLLSQIENTVSFKNKISTIESFLIKNLTEKDSPAYLDASLRFFERQVDQRVSVKETCNHLSVSNKSLIKTYQKHIGVSPIKYLQTQSINKALQRLAKDPLQSFSNLAHDLNFFDQSHFINTFKAATSLTPSQYSEKVLSNNVDQCFPNFISCKG